MKKSEKDIVEVWVAEIPGVEMKVFGQDKEGAATYCREHTPDAVMWDMMSGPSTKDYDDPKAND
jgi:hypothetical protein